MISINKVSAGAASGYYKAEGYYTAGSEEGERATTWMGREAEEVGLDGPVDDATFQRLLDGQAPNGQLLGRMVGGERKFVPGHDITLSAPKEVSVAALVIGDTRLIGAHDRAVAKAMAYVEDHLLETRKMVNGRVETVPAAGMIAGQFRHMTSRELEAQLHTHTVIANMVKAKGDTTYRALENRKVLTYQKLVTQIYHGELYRQVRSLGWEAERDRDGFTRLLGVPENLVKAHSTRSEQIKAALEERGQVPTAAAKERAALATRARKAGAIDLDRLFEVWHEDAKALGIGAARRALIRDSNMSPRAELRAVRNDRGPRSAARSDAERAVSFAKAHLSERNATYDRAEFLTVAHRYARAAGAAEIAAAFEQRLKSGALFAFTDARGAEKLSDQESLALERAMLAEWRKTDKLRGPRLQSRTADVLSGRRTAENDLTRKLAKTPLTESQRYAVFTALTGKGRYVGIQGDAGTGKTFMMAKLRAQAEKAGYAVEGLAPTQKARDELEAVIPGARTIKHRLVREATRGSGTRNNKRTILVVDEASMISTRDMRDLLAHANARGYARVILVGDEKQLDPVEAGSPFAQLQKAGLRTALMDDIIRQRDGSMEKSSVLFAIAGNVSAAIENIRKIDETPAIAGRLAEAWLARSPEKRADTGIVVQTNALRRAVNADIRTGLKAEGTLGARDISVAGLRNLGLTRAQAGDLRSYRSGDLVIATRSMPKLGLRLMGEYDVTSRDERREVITLRDRETGQDLTIRLGQGSRAAAALQVFERETRAFAAGDKVRFRMSDTAIGIINGEEGVIRQASDQSFTVLTKTGLHRIETGSMLARGMEHAYAQTAHGFQGQTVNEILIGMKADERLANLKQFYVSISRMKDGAHLVTDNVERLSARLQANTGIEATALESWLTSRTAREVEAQMADDKAPETERKATPGAREDPRASQEDWRKGFEDRKAEDKARLAALEASVKEQVKEIERQAEKIIERNRSIGPSF